MQRITIAGAVALLIALLQPASSASDSFACPTAIPVGRDPCNDVCSLSGTTLKTLTCDLSSHGGVQGGEAYVVSGYSASHDVSAWGEDATGARFCCTADNVQYFVVSGGPGDDLLSLVAMDRTEASWTLENAWGVTISGRGGNDVIYGYNDEPLDRAETLDGGAGDDLIFGQAGDDTLVGGRDNDTLLSGPGSDEVRGDDGSDVLRGGTGPDQMYGDDGGDVLCGDAGDDVLNGGAGNDHLYGGVGADRAFGGNGFDSCDAEVTPTCESSLSALPLRCQSAGVTYADRDGDGYGNPDEAKVGGWPPLYVTNDDDCDDTDPSVNTCVTWQYIGPGGMGNFPAVATTSDGNVIYAGTDVGGVFVSQDGGQSFQSANDGLDTIEILDVEVVEDSGTTTAYLGTNIGVYQRIDNGSWELREDGFCNPDDPSFTCPDTPHPHPVQVVTVDPQDSNTIWAGIGDSAHPNNGNARNADDPCHIYQSTDAGVSWSCSLKIDGATVYSIAISPGLVYVGTNRGLYATDDGGMHWYEVGIADVRVTVNSDPAIPAGSTWESCSTSSDCISPRFAATSCTEGVDCLPIISTRCGDTDATPCEAHPNIRSVSLLEVDGTEYLHVAIWDAGYYEGCSDTNKREPYTDPDTGRDYFRYFRGGPYRSTDGGLRFSWLFTDDGTSTGMPNPDISNDETDSGFSIFYRCQGQKENTTTNFPYLAVNATNPDQIMLGAHGQRGGLYEYNAATVNYLAAHNDECLWNNIYTNAVGRKVYYYACFEGLKSESLSGGGTGPSVKSPLVVVDWSGSDPELLFGQDRGVTRATWDSSNSRYYFEHLSNDLVDPADDGQEHPESEPYAWSSTGLDDVCPYGGVAFMTPTTGDEAGKSLMFLGVGDGSLLRSADNGASWRKIADLWPTNVPIAESWALLADDTDSDGTPDQLYVASDDGNTGGSAYAVLMSSDGYLNWTVIGGNGYSNGDNGLTPTTERMGVLYTMALDYSSRPSQRRLLLGTSRSGLYLYDPTKTAGSQWQLVDDGRASCPWSVSSATRLSINDILTSPEWPSFAFVTFDDSDDVSKDGVYVVDLTTLACSKLADSLGTTMMDPTALGVAQDSTGHDVIIVGADRQSDGYPVLYQASLDMATSTPTLIDAWTEVLDPSALVDPSDPYYTDLEEHYFADIEVHPTDATIVLAGMGASAQNVNYNISHHLYVSQDGGHSFTTAPNLEFGLPLKNVRKLQFDATGENLYTSTRCASLYVADLPLP
jgi:hypothetical protein